jgi:hypothetical protein
MKLGVLYFAYTQALSIVFGLLAKISRLLLSKCSFMGDHIKLLTLSPVTCLYMFYMQASRSFSAQQNSARYVLWSVVFRVGTLRSLVSVVYLTT